MTIKELHHALGVASRMTVLAALRKAGYLSSYSHAGKYYTLLDIPTFDERGLWFHGEARFSKHGTLRRTIVVLVTEAPAGYTHEELATVLGLRVHDTLRSLVEANEIGRVRIDVVYLYVAVDPDTASAQLSQREAITTAAAPAKEPQAPTVGPVPEMDLARVVDVLVAVIHAPRDDPHTIAARLRAMGLLVSEEQVEAVFEQYGLPEKKNGALPLSTLAALRKHVRALEQQRREQMRNTRGVLVQTAEPPPDGCSKCGAPMNVRKTVRRTGNTLAHGTFEASETVYVCSAGCTTQGPAAPSPVKPHEQRTKAAVQALTHRSEVLAGLLLPRRTVGYDLLVHVGLQRYVHRQQRKQICDSLEQDYGIALSTGQISILARDFLVYLEALHELCAPRLREVLERDGGYPLHIDATGEAGRGTLLVAWAGWRGWVLGSWKLDTERADAILPRLRLVVARFGDPCAVMRDLGHAVIEAATALVEMLGGHIPIFGCAFHFLRDVGKDLLTGAYDTLRSLFRRFKIRPGLRVIARDMNRRLGDGIEAARRKVEGWLADPSMGYQLPGGTTGLAAVRAIAQWVLNYKTDGNNEGFPFDLPYLDFQHRSSRALRATEAFLRCPLPDRQVQRLVERLHRTLEPVRGEVPFARTTLVLERRARLFAELRQALRLRAKADVVLPSERATPAEFAQLQDIERSIMKLTAALRTRRPQRGPAKDMRDAIDLVLDHLERHGPSLFGHLISLPEAAGGGVRLVARTNLALERFFGAMMHGERLRSGRKHLGQDLEHLPGGAPLAQNLTRPDYVDIVCGSLDRLPEAFAQLDAADRRFALPVRNRAAPKEFPDVVGSSLPRADQVIVRSEELEQRIRDAARSRAPRRQPTRNRALAQAQRGTL